MPREDIFERMMRDAEPLAKNIDRAMTDNELAVDWIRMRAEIDAMRILSLANQLHLRQLRWMVPILMAMSFAAGFCMRGLW